MIVNRSECVFDACDGMHCSVDEYSPMEEVFCRKSMYIDASSQVTACERHKHLLNRAENARFIRINKICELLSPSEAVRLLESTEAKMTESTPVTQRVIYEVAYTYEIVDGEGNSYEELENKALQELLSEVKEAPNQMTEVIEAIRDDIVYLKTIPDCVADDAHYTPKPWKCEVCGRNSNLWLNLSDGFIGCGRRQYGIEGSGCEGDKEGAAILHWQENPTRHLGLKLGTLTATNCEVYSYEMDMFVALPREKINERLAAYKVHVGDKASERTMDELLQQANQALALFGSTDDFKSRISDGGLGLVNIGNSCYVASVLHCLKLVYSQNPPLLREFEVPPKTVSEAVLCLCRSLLSHQPDKDYDERYTRERALLKEEVAKINPKLRFDLLFSAHDELYHYGAPSPVFLKRLVGASYMPFNNKEQQDVEEFLQVLYNRFEQDGDNLLRMNFEIAGQQKTHMKGDTVRLTAFKSPVIELDLGDDSEPIAFEDLLAKYRNSGSGLTKFPRYLLMVIRRQALDPLTQQPAKNARPVTFSAESMGRIDLGAAAYSIKSPGLAANEVEYQDALSEEMLRTITPLGISKERFAAVYNKLCREASLYGSWATQEITTEAVLSSILDDPELSVSETTVSPEKLSFLVGMGYSEALAHKALELSSGDVEEATNLLLSGTVNVDAENSSTYQLRAAIIHLGSSVIAGHYVALVKQEDQWWRYNDECVSPVDNAMEALSQSYMLMFQKIEF